MKRKVYVLKPEYKYRGGTEFEEFVFKNRAKNPLKIKFYLTEKEVSLHKGSYPLVVVDVNNFRVYQGKRFYEKKVIYVDYELWKRVKSNVLF
jgi:hypothetical protein